MEPPTDLRGSELYSRLAARQEISMKIVMGVLLAMFYGLVALGFKVVTG